MNKTITRFECIDGFAEELDEIIYEGVSWFLPKTIIYSPCECFFNALGLCFCFSSADLQLVCFLQVPLHCLLRSFFLSAHFLLLNQLWNTQLQTLWVDTKPFPDCLFLITNILSPFSRWKWKKIHSVLVRSTSSGLLVGDGSHSKQILACTGPCYVLWQEATSAYNFSMWVWQPPFVEINRQNAEKFCCLKMSTKVTTLFLHSWVQPV